MKKQNMKEDELLKMKLANLPIVTEEKRVLFVCLFFGHKMKQRKLIA
jgi:hypothetical protein